MNEKLAKLRTMLAGRGLDAIYVTDPANIRCLSGYTGSAAFLFISAQKSYLITDHRFTEQAGRECADFEVIPHLLPEPTPPQLVERFCREEGVKTLAFEESLRYMFYRQLRDILPQAVELRAVSGLIEELRYVKSPREIELTRLACAATDRVLAKICAYLRPGLSEKEVARELLYYILSEGCDSSFDIIIASGDNGSLPHAIPGDKLLKQGEFVTMDFGCAYQGYHADMTRTVYLGQPDERAREVYALVLEAKNRAQSIIKAGLPCREADAAARDFLAEQGYGEQFKHGLGHGVGLEIHEAPRLNPTSTMTLQSGCLVTVEPGLYFPGRGGVRIEDTVLITDTGYENMFSSSTELLCID